MICIGLTGIFGSGKSTVSRIFKKMNIPVISCDAIVDKLLKKKEIKRQIAHTFGDEYLDKNGEIDRKKLAMLVFSFPRQRESLNEIIHPQVFKMLGEKLDMHRKKGKMAVVVEIPLLFETRSEKLFDAIITVASPLSVIKERLKEKYSPEEIDMRIKSQMPLAKKIRLSDYVIDNSGTITQMQFQVKKILQDIMRRN
ncbi:MAG: dephospho-CoA kinase [Candidatus Omnitrophica bacterium]|nr:dephospho-CoA kinase [Candidatus Omnitrophota bacterium]MCM8829020.1 dephospho-CoA kinase [Candidatus Omnitrophota bacterium]